MCYSRRKSTQFCNIYIANIGLFTVQTIIIIIFNTNLAQNVQIERNIAGNCDSQSTKHLTLQRFQ
jgi:hypothetical protein